MNKPDFLILDEPVNGLDPEGIVEIRKIIQELNQAHGTTILISSHLLSELSMLATRYGIIHQGKIVKEITKEELELECNSEIKLLTSDDEKTHKVLKEQGFAIQKENQQLHIIQGMREDMEKIGKSLFDKGIYIKEMSYKEEQLEEYFLDLIGGK
ncbi:ATP-binding cassette domain-containing protein [Pilibacter termitis]|uniref:hypothetical protein n=1 Tax=Pilibacter termitis TaxID=263852 RepID=UPI001F279BF7|nr:hypothetical protein [Pilibacter termitis]